MARSDHTLPAAWARATVGDVGTVQLGLKKSPDRNTGRYGTKYLRAANITSDGFDLTSILEMDFSAGDRERYRLREGDILLAEASGSASQVGRAAIWRGEIQNCCFQMTLIRFRPIVVVPEFAILVFKHYAATGKFAKGSRGIGIQHLSAGRFSEMPFPLPSLSEQARIAEAAHGRLTELRLGEQRLRSAIEKLQVQEREIIAAAVEGRLTTETAKPIAQAPPSSWPTISVGDAGEVRIGRQLSSTANRSGQLRKYLRVANVLENKIDYDDLKQMRFNADERRDLRLKAGDILLNEGQSLEWVGRAAMYRGELKELYFQNTLIRFRARSTVSNEYALLVFRHYLHSGRFQQIAHRSTNIAHLGLRRFAELPFPLPPLAEQQQLARAASARLKSWADQKRSTAAALARIPQLQHEILRAAVQGKLSTRDPHDEDATDLLARGRELIANELQREAEMAAKPPQAEAPTGLLSITGALRDAAKPLTVANLFARMGLDRDSVEDVERFYLSLRSALGKTIRQRGSGEKSTLELIHAS